MLVPGAKANIQVLVKSDSTAQDCFRSRWSLGYAWIGVTIKKRVCLAVLKNA